MVCFTALIRFNRPFTLLLSKIFIGICPEKQFVFDRKRKYDFFTAFGTGSYLIYCGIPALITLY